MKEENMSYLRVCKKCGKYWIGGVNGVESCPHCDLNKSKIAFNNLQNAQDRLVSKISSLHEQFKKLIDLITPEELDLINRLVRIEDKLFPKREAPKQNKKGKKNK